jgi:hypothetical protein
MGFKRNNHHTGVESDTKITRGPNSQSFQQFFALWADTSHDFTGASNPLVDRRWLEVTAGLSGFPVSDGEG